jgi:integrase
MSIAVREALELEVMLFEKLAAYGEHAKGSFAPATEQALLSDQKVFFNWCAGAGRVALPASPETVAAYIAEMGETKKPSTIRRAVSTISTLHKAAEARNPAESLIVKLVLKRLHREKGRAQRQAAPLTRTLVERLLAASGASLRDLRNQAILGLGYDSLCRQSEIAALQLEDLTLDPSGSGTVLIRRSKSDQEGQGMTRYIHTDTAGLLRAWLAAAGHSDGALFRSVLRGGRLGGPLRGPDIARLFKEMALAAGLPAEEAARISGHSARVGGAQDMLAANVELPAILQAGGWRSPEMAMRYGARTLAKRSGAAKLAVIQNR